MWNTWAESAKSFAKNIDKQISESVGLEDAVASAPNAAASADASLRSTGSSAASAVTSPPPSAGVGFRTVSSSSSVSNAALSAPPFPKPASRPQKLTPDNAWNDFDTDFDSFGSAPSKPAPAASGAADPAATNKPRISAPAPSKPPVPKLVVPTRTASTSSASHLPNGTGLPVAPGSGPTSGHSSDDDRKKEATATDTSDQEHAVENNPPNAEDRIDNADKLDTDDGRHDDDGDDEQAAGSSSAVVSPDTALPNADDTPSVEESQQQSQQQTTAAKNLPPQEQQPIHPGNTHATTHPSSSQPAPENNDEGQSQTHHQVEPSNTSWQETEELSSGDAKPVDGDPPAQSLPSNSNGNNAHASSSSSNRENLSNAAALSKATNMFSTFSKAATPLGSSFLLKADALINKAVEHKPGEDTRNESPSQAADSSDNEVQFGDSNHTWNDHDNDATDDIHSGGDSRHSNVSTGKSTVPISNATDTVVAEAATTSDETKSAEEKPPSSQQEPTTAMPESDTAPTPAATSGTFQEDNGASNAEVQALRQNLQLREKQLADKAEQLAQLQSMWESTESELKQQIQNTKDEAKKRIQRAKERCEAAENKLLAASHQTSENSAQQSEIIAALRREGETLARKQAEMEKSIRQTKSEARQLREKLEDETIEKEHALERIAELEADLKSSNEALASARKGESAAGKLETELLEARSDAELKAGQILSLEQNVKELKAQVKDLEESAQMSQKSAAIEAAKESKKMRREHNDIIADLEQKLRANEKEAAVREDALRHEVSEIRKRWEDAVRRADSLSMDMQLSTAPLLRQLESKERANRARAAAWAELETKLRSDLEEAIVQNDSFNKERSDLKSQVSRAERLAAEREKTLDEAKETIDEQSKVIQGLESRLKQVEDEAERLRLDYAEMQRLANEGVARVRNEMSQTVLDSEERYRGHIERLESDLAVEREKKKQLETQVQQLLENAASMMTSAPAKVRREAKPKKLRQAEGQADILAGALIGLDESDNEYEEDDDDEEEDDTAMVTISTSEQTGAASFAAHEQLTSKLKVTQVECKALRASLRESEKTREQLLEELVKERGAKERLDSFETRVKELEEESMEKSLEIEGLRSDIVDVKELYRSQLSMLLEEKAATSTPPVASASPEGDSQNHTDDVEDDAAPEAELVQNEE